MCEKSKNSPQVEERLQRHFVVGKKVKKDCKKDSIKGSNKLMWNQKLGDEECRTVSSEREKERERNSKEYILY